MPIRHAPSVFALSKASGMASATNVETGGNGWLITYPQICSITLRNTTANAVTGGVSIKRGATVIVTAQAVGANELVVIKDADILKRVATTLGNPGETITFDAVTDWNGASLEVTILYSGFATTRLPV